MTNATAASDSDSDSDRNRDKDRDQAQFISIIAHELRYPLAPIRNAAALLKRDTTDVAMIRRAADIIERQASAMHRLIGDLAEASRMQRGALELRRARTPLAAVVERAVELAGPFASERGHTLSVSVAPDPIYLLVDAPRLVQVLHRIITNATQYTDRHGYLHVRAQRDGAHALVTVSDTGIGIPAGELESIFGLFVHSAPGARIEPGLGLGLYLSRHLIEAHQGTLTAASDGPGRGSVFTIRLPCERPPGEPTTAGRAGSSVEASAADPSPA